MLVRHETILRNGTFTSSLLLACISCLAMMLGCRTTAPIFVWYPQQYELPNTQRIALAPVLADGDLPTRIEHALLLQRPLTRTDFSLVTSSQLQRTSYVMPAAFLPTVSNVNAAREWNSQILMVGQVLQTNVNTTTNGQPIGESPSHSQQAQGVPADKKLVMFWRLIDVNNDRALGSHTLSIDTKRADAEYPDLLFEFPDPSERILMAGARESWKSLAPFIGKESIELAQPWLMPGSAQVRKGNTLAKQGRWDLAEAQWRAAAGKHRWNNAAQLNFAVGLAAKEDFEGALAQLGKLGPIGHQDQQAELLFWFDQHHRWYRTAHRLPPPEKGWAFPDPVSSAASVQLASDVPGPDEQPWWTAIPGTKPPGWTWRAWLSQPWLF